MSQLKTPSGGFIDLSNAIKYRRSKRQLKTITEDSSAVEPIKEGAGGQPGSKEYLTPTASDIIPNTIAQGIHAENEISQIAFPIAIQTEDSMVRDASSNAGNGASHAGPAQSWRERAKKRLTMGPKVFGFDLSHRDSLASKKNVDERRNTVHLGSFMEWPTEKSKKRATLTRSLSVLDRFKRAGSPTGDLVSPGSSQVTAGGSLDHGIQHESDSELAPGSAHVEGESSKTPHFSRKLSDLLRRHKAAEEKRQTSEEATEQTLRGLRGKLSGAKSSALRRFRMASRGEQSKASSPPKHPPSFQKGEISKPMPIVPNGRSFSKARQEESGMPIMTHHATLARLEGREEIPYPEAVAAAAASEAAIVEAMFQEKLRYLERLEEARRLDDADEEVRRREQADREAQARFEAELEEYGCEIPRESQEQASMREDQGIARPDSPTPGWGN